MKFPIPGDWDGESWCRWAVCWPESEQWEGFLRGLLTLPQRGWTWDERSGSILDVQQIGREITELNLPLNGVIMACNDTELVASFNEIAAALRYMADRQFERPCCGDGGTVAVGTGGYAGTTIQPGSGVTIPIYGTQPPAELEEGQDYPDGFESVEEWDVHKCAIANLIFDGVIYTLAFLAGLNTTNITVLAGLIGAGIAGILVFPPIGIAVMVGAVAALFGFLAMFLTIREEMLARREEFVCAMYGATSVKTAIAVLGDLMDLVIALVTTSGPLGAAIKTVLLLLFNGDALNQLFDSSADYSYPDANCEGCLPCAETWFRFDDDNEGFVSVGSLPSCFGLTVNGSASVAWDSGVLEVTVTGGTPGRNGAFGKTGLDILIADETHLQTTLRTSGAGGLYIDYVIVFSDSSCLWGTLSNADPASGTFHGISASLEVHTGKHIEELYFYLSSSTAGPDATYLVEFDEIGFFCE